MRSAPVSVSMSWLTCGLLAAALAVACGPTSGADGSGGTWPMDMTQPGVLGYASLPLGGPGLEEALEGLLGYRVRGLGEAHPVVLVPLDAAALGGGLALMAPVADEELFRATLELWDGLEQVGPDRYRLTPDPDSGLGTALGALGAASASGAAAGWLGGLGSALPKAIPMHLVVEDGRVLVAPTFEALGACRTLGRKVPGLADGWRRAAVVSLDVDRARRAWAPQLAQARAKLMSAVSTIAMMAGAEGELPTLAAELPRWVGAVLDQLHTRDIEALQWRLGLSPGRRPGDGGAPPPSGDPLAGSGLDLAALGLDGTADLDVRMREGSSLHHLLEALEPAPDVPDALFVEALGPEATAAFARWLEPFRAALSPEERAGLDELLPAVADFQGTIAVVSSPSTGNGEPRPVLLLSPSRGGSVDWHDTLERWVTMLDAAAASWGGPGPRFTLGVDGRGLVELRGGEAGGSDVWLTAGNRGAVAWIAPGAGEVPPGVCDALAAALSDVPDDGPVVRMGLPLGGLRLRGQARVDGPWLRGSLSLEEQP